MESQIQELRPLQPLGRLRVRAEPSRIRPRQSRLRQPIEKRYLGMRTDANDHHLEQIEAATERAWEGSRSPVQPGGP